MAAQPSMKPVSWQRSKGFRLLSAKLQCIDVPRSTLLSDWGSQKLSKHFIVWFGLNGGLLVRMVIHFSSPFNSPVFRCRSSWQLSKSRKRRD